MSPMMIFVLVSFWTAQGGGASVQGAFQTQHACEKELTLEAIIGVQAGIKGIRLKCESIAVDMN